MIKVSVGDLSSPALETALQKLTSTQVGVKAAYRFKKLADAVNTHMNWARDAYTKEVVNQFGVFDEKKQLIPAKTPWGFELKEGTDVQQFEKANDEFHKKVLTIDRPPLNILELNDVKLSAADLTALGVFFNDPETAVEGDNVAQLRR